VKDKVQGNLVIGGPDLTCAEIP